MSKRYNRRRHVVNHGISIVLFIFAMSSIAVLVAILSSIFAQGLSGISWDFLTGFPSRRPEDAGILPALVGSLMVVGGSMLFAVPIGLATAIYLQEFAKAKRFTGLIQTLIYNLAGVPSIVYGIFGATFFVIALKTMLMASGSLMTTGRVLLAGILTMGILILPVIVVTTQEAIKTVPRSLKEASYALGATQVQTTFKITARYAFPNILTGIILAISRVLGETAPLLMVGAAGFITFLPTDLFGGYTVLPVQIYNWMMRPQVAFQTTAAAGIIVLLLTQVIISGTAIIVRAVLQKRYE